MSEATTNSNSTNASATASNSNGIPKKSRVSRGNSGANSANTKSLKNRGYRRRNSNDRPKDGEEELDEEEQCIICANKIEYAAVTPCNHKTCHKCTLRQRALYKKTTCLVCRSENETVIITEQLDKLFPDFDRKDIVKNDDKYKIDFTSNYCYEDSMALLRNTCQICSREFSSFKELGDHAKAEHGKFYCFICSEHKKAFIPELEMYTYKQLLRHQSEGDQIGFKGHPECKYCLGKRFYSEDELNVHVRDRHERCYICDQYLPKTADYYRNYDSLYNHFRKDHYVCSVPTCVEKRFVVFREDLDLTAHMLKEHGGVGGNNKIVIGSSGFRSQLSTFNESVTRNNANWQSSHEEEDHNNPEVKKKRFEERAKHYVNYDQTKLQTFLNINASYRNKKISAQDLSDQYKSLFENESPENLGILIGEFAELFPTTSDSYKNLQPVLKDLDQLNTQNQFPVLGGSGSRTALNPSWVKTPTKKGAKSQHNPHDLFPTLARPNKPTPKVNNTPIKYTRVSLSPAPQPKVKVNTYKQAAHTPNYLNNLSPSSSVTSLPALGSSSGRSSPRILSPTVQTYSNPTSRPGSAIIDSKFPALQQKAKKIIPRVNPITVTDPKQWGTTTASPPPTEDPTDFGIGVIVKKGKGKRR